MTEAHVLRTEPRLTSEVSTTRNSPSTQGVTRNLPKTATLNGLTGAANQARWAQVSTCPKQSPRATRDVPLGHRPRFAGQSPQLLVASG